MRWIAPLLFATIGCAARPGALRFETRAPHWRVADDRPVAKPKAIPPAGLALYHFDNNLDRPLSWVLGVPDRGPARDVNSLGEVPNSTWFTNRIGAGEVPLHELGPCREQAPRLPLSVTKLKYAPPGFFATDATGRRWLVKFDEPQWPELGTGAAIVGQRLVRAAGYHTPEDCLVHLGKGDLVSAKEAEIEAVLAPLPRDRSGRVRALVSLMLPGEPLGTFPDMGTRKDDHNDHVPHEYRRSLRGFYVFAAWLQHTDLTSNRIDMWVADPQQPGRGHVTHHLIDFDRALGAMGVITNTEWDGYAHGVDYKFMVPSLFTFGLWRRPWEGIHPPKLRGIGRIESDHFDPKGFRTRIYYMPFTYRDDLDLFWGAKILARLRPEHIRTAVDAAEYSDPRSAAYLTATLLERQRILLRHAFDVVNPLDRFRVYARDGTAVLCATDLLLHYELADIGSAYDAIVYDGRGRRLAARRGTRPDHEGTFCIDELPIGRGARRYTIVGLRTWRGTKVHPPVFVHLADVEGELRIIGIDRRPGRARRS
jgi:hypothetical protein